MNKMILFTVLLLGCLLAGSATAQIHDSYSPVNGQPHPDFVLPDIVDGAPVQLSQFRGKKVLLLHFASW